MKKIKKFLLGIFNLTYRILLEYSKYVLLVIVLIVCADVVGRNLFANSIMWAQEVSLLFIVWMTFLSLAIGAEKDAHIAIELFYMKFPKPMKKVIDIINKLVTLCIGIFLAYYGAGLVSSTWSSTLAATRWPAGMLYLMIPVGGVCMVIFSIMDLLGLKKYKKTDYYGDGEPAKSLDE